MKNIHILPTDKDSKLYLGNLGKPVTIQSASAQFKKPLHIYITDNSEIKEGDWIFDIVTKRIEIAKFNHNDLKRDWKKIILTTDQDLIKDGVQAIDDEFLEWFVKNPSCDSVKINLVPVNEFGSEITVGGYGFDKFKYKIIILKEEPNPLTVGKEFYESADKNITVYRQETLEEAIDRIAKEDGYDIDGSKVADFVDGMVKGVKWQQEQDKNKYSEEEVLDLLHRRSFHLTHKKDTKTTKEWFEQFKKK
jgi:hypothetical protein